MTKKNKIILGSIILLIGVIIGFTAYKINKEVNPYDGCTSLSLSSVVDGTDAVIGARTIQINEGATLSSISLEILNRYSELTRYSLKDIEYTIVKWNSLENEDSIHSGRYLTVPYLINR